MKDEHVGKILKSYRLKHRLTQEDMSTKIGSSVLSYRELERGGTNVNMNRVFYFAEIFQIPITEFLPDKGRSGKNTELQLEINKLKQLLEKADQEVITLRQKAIELYEIADERRRKSLNSIP